MVIFRTLFLALLLGLGLTAQLVLAQDTNLRPKYGSQPRNDAERAADAKFIAAIDDYYKGDRKRAADEIAQRGWELLRRGNGPDAMRRFNQAWLLDKANGKALWGMAVLQAGSGKVEDSLKLFAEADGVSGSDIDFAVDYAKTVGLAGAQTKNEVLLKEAFARYARIYDMAPQHTLNLQNWAITLYYVGDYAEAWDKIKLAESTPRHAELDPRFLAALQAKMPRP